MNVIIDCFGFRYFHFQVNDLLFGFFIIIPHLLYTSQRFLFDCRKIFNNLLLFRVATIITSKSRATFTAKLGADWMYLLFVEIGSSDVSSFVIGQV